MHIYHFYVLYKGRGNPTSTTEGNVLLLLLEGQLYDDAGKAWELICHFEVGATTV